MKALKGGQDADQVPNAHSDGEWQAAVAGNSGRRVSQWRHQNGEKRWIVIMQALFISHRVQVDAASGRPCRSRKYGKVRSAHLQEGAPNFNNDAEDDGNQSKQCQG
jgi:hypothetical protein